MPKATTRRYLVLAGTSTRKSTDPKSPAFNEWCDFRAGDEVDEGAIPRHTPVAEWLSSGHWKPLEEGS